MAKTLIDWFKFALLALVLILWVFYSGTPQNTLQYSMFSFLDVCLQALGQFVLSALILVETTVIRQDLSRLALVTEGTSIGDFYINIFFPVIFPVLVTVSCFVFVIGCIGCCGAFTESQVLLGWFFFSVLVSFCVELSAGIWRLISYQLCYNDSDFDQLKINIVKYGSQDSSLWFQSAWKEIQQKFNCCGVRSYQDWSNAKISLLYSCCPPKCTRQECTVLLEGVEGCGDLLLGYLSKSKEMALLPYLMAAMGITQVIALMLALKLWLSFCFNSHSKHLAQGETERPKSSVRGSFYPFYQQNSYPIVTPLGFDEELQVLREQPLHVVNGRAIMVSDHQVPYVHSSFTRNPRPRRNTRVHRHSRRQHNVVSTENDVATHKQRHSCSKNSSRDRVRQWSNSQRSVTATPKQSLDNCATDCTLFEVHRSCSSRRSDEMPAARWAGVGAMTSDCGVKFVADTNDVAVLASSPALKSFSAKDLPFTSSASTVQQSTVESPTGSGLMKTSKSGTVFLLATNSG